VALSIAVAAQVLLYSQVDWRAGVSWGPRYLTDILPILMWMLAPAPLVLRPARTRPAHPGDGGVRRRADDRSVLVYDDE
jgi:hypothetical protein